MQERAGNFDAPHLTAGEVAHFIVRAVRQRDARQHLIGARAAVVLADAVQGGVVGQILNHGEIEVERALLEYDADHAQSLARRMSDVAAENPDMTALDRVEARDQREQRALSGSVEAEQNGEGGWRDGEGHVVERLTPAVAMAHAFDGDGGRVDGRHFLHHAGVRFLRRSPTGRHAGPSRGSPSGIRRALLRPCGLRLAKACRPVGSHAANTNVVVSQTGVKRTAKLSLLRNCDTPRKLADLDRLDDPQIRDVDDGDVIRYAVGRQKIFFVGGKRHVPHALAHEKIFLDLVGRAVDHGDAIGGAERYESGLAVPGDADPDRLDGYLPQPRYIEGDLLLHLVFHRVDDAHGSADFG